MDVAAPIQMLLRKANASRLPLAVVSMDVRAPLDRMHFPLVPAALWAQGAPGQLGTATTAPIPLQVGCKQEGVAPPLLWNILLAGPVVRLQQVWWARGGGLP